MERSAVYQFPIYQLLLCFILFYRNSFSQLVGEEFLRFFDFTNETIDAALRQYVKHLTMTSESQDREQLLSHFAHRYYECNTSAYKSEGN